MELNYKNVTNQFEPISKKIPQTTSSKNYSNIVECFNKLIYYSTEEYNEIEIKKILMTIPNLIEPSSSSEPVYLPETYFLFLLDLYKNTENEIFKNFILIIFYRIIINDPSSIKLLLENHILSFILPSFENFKLNVSIRSFMNLIEFFVSSKVYDYCMDILTIRYFISIFPRVKMTTDLIISWLECLNELFENKIKIEINEINYILNLFSDISEEYYYDTLISAKICWIIVELIKKKYINNLEMLKQNKFTLKLISYYKSNDHRLIEASATLIGYLAIENVIINEFDYDLICNVCKNCRSSHVFKSSFWVYLIMIEKNPEYVDYVYNTNKFDFFKMYNKVSFHYKKEIAYFLSFILKYTQERHIQYLFESHFLQIIYESISFENNQFIDIVLEGLINVGEIVVNQSLIEQYAEIKDKVQTGEIVEIIQGIGDENLNTMLHLILSDYCFLL